MLGTEHNGMVLALMVSVYGRKAKEEQKNISPATKLAMYAFYDAMERTAVAFNQVLDAKRLPREAFDLLIDYSTRLENQLEEMDDTGEEVSSVDTELHEASQEA